MPSPIPAVRISLPTALARLALLIAAGAWIAGCSQPTDSASQQRPAAGTQTAATHDHADDEHGHDDHGHDEHGHDDHGHDDHGHDDAASFTPPQTIAEALTQLKQLSAKIEEALAEKKTKLADDLVHSAGHLIEDLHEKIASAGLKEKAQAAATAAAEAIFDVYDKLDTALHGAEEELKKIDFSSYAPSLDKATATLETLLLKAEEAVTGTPAEKPAAEKPAAEKPTTEKPTTEKPTTEKPTTEKPASEKPAAEKPAAEAQPSAPPEPAPAT